MYTNVLLRIHKGIPEWAVHPKRLEYHEDVDSIFMKVKDDPDYVPSAKFITNCSKFGPIEITLNTPYRAGKVDDNREGKSSE